jgi:hypothetical protein
MVNVIRPYLSAAKDAQDSSAANSYDIDGDERRTSERRARASGDSAGASALWKVEKPPRGDDNLIVDINRRAGFRLRCV